jgi:outer membrane protein assembly factor BamD
VEADLLQAHSYYMSGKYFEAISAYEDFVKKNPNNENIKLAYYRIAKSYDYQASEEIDRDQSNTKKAILKYYSYLKLFPYSQPAEEVSQRVHILTRRLSESEAFVARFYFKRNLYAAALLRYEYLIKNYSEYEDLLKESIERAAFCYEKLSLFLKKNPNSDEYTQFNYLNQEDLIKKSQDLRDHLKNDSKK